MAYKRISPIVVTEGGTGSQSSTAYGVLCGGTTGAAAFQPISPGVAGYALTSSGAGALPVFQAQVGGNIVLIQTQTVTSVASVVFTTGITSTYNNYLLFCTNLKFATSASSILLQISTDGGVSYISSGYVNAGSASAIYTGTAALGGANITVGSGAGVSLYWSLYNLTSGSGNCMSTVSGHFYNISGGTDGAIANSGVYTVASTTVNALKFVESGGTSFTGSFSLYGITS